MATIRAVCTDCGDEVDLRPSEITLVVADDHEHAHGLADQETAGSYGFTCPACERYVVKPADQRAIGLLIAGGVEPSRVTGTPATATATMRAMRPVHPEAPPGGPVLTLDDLIDLHFELQDDDWFERVLAMTLRPW